MSRGPSGDVTASMDSSGGQVVIEGEIGRWVNENCREGGAYDFADRFFFEREDGSREPTAFPFELASKSEDDVAKVDVSVRSGSDVLNKTFRAVLLVKDSAGNDARVTDTFTITF